MATLEFPLRERGVCCAPTLSLPPERAGELADVLKALADPTRLQIVLCLRDVAEPACICDLTGCFDLSQPTLSHHMQKLREAGLVESEKRGIWTFFRLRRDLPAVTRRLIDSLA